MSQRTEPRRSSLRGGIPSEPAATNRDASRGIGAVVHGVLQEAHRRHGALFTVQRNWRKLVGKELAAHTKPVGLRSRRLIIHADRPGDNFALTYQRSRLLERVQRLTQGKIDELMVRAGEVHAVSD